MQGQIKSFENSTFRKIGDVRGLVASGFAFICDECVRVAVEVIGGEHPQWLDDLREAIDRGDTTIGRLR
jgi:hypothetical protein